jgi:hypothetical protein
MYQKCIIWLTDGTKLVYEGEAQYDTEARPKVRKVQFSVPIDDDILPEDDIPLHKNPFAGDDAVNTLMGMFGMKK